MVALCGLFKLRVPECGYCWFEMEKTELSCSRKESEMAHWSVISERIWISSELCRPWDCGNADSRERLWAGSPECRRVRS